MRPGPARFEASAHASLAGITPRRCRPHDAQPAAVHPPSEAELGPAARGERARQHVRRRRAHGRAGRVRGRRAAGGVSRELATASGTSVTVYGALNGAQARADERTVPEVLGRAFGPVPVASARALWS